MKYSFGMGDVDSLRQEYLNKKSKIKERLSHFERFWSEPVHWNYADGDIKLMPSSKKDDRRIFEELSFCIFTANTSAEMGAKAVDIVRGILEKGTAEQMTKKLIGNYRFINLRPQYIVHTRENFKNTIGFRLKDKIKSFKDKNELRDYLVANVKGLGMKEASHFLRNIGFKGYGILDKHIINSMHEFGVLKTNGKPKNVKEYLEMEQKLIDFSKKIGIDLDELDLLLWSRKNGRILK
jgi:N-glycosylase/DNA lyase